MAKGRWKTHESILEQIQDILKKVGFVSTNKVGYFLEQKGYRYSWRTIKKALQELEADGIIESIKLGGVNEINIWRLK